MPFNGYAPKCCKVVSQRSILHCFPPRGARRRRRVEGKRERFFAESWLWWINLNYFDDYLLLSFLHATFFRSPLVRQSLNSYNSIDWHSICCMKTRNAKHCAAAAAAPHNRCHQLMLSNSIKANGRAHSFRLPTDMQTHTHTHTQRRWSGLWMEIISEIVLLSFCRRLCDRYRHAVHPIRSEFVAQSPCQWVKSVRATERRNFFCCIYLC